jgi:hypothetical protein
MAKALSIKDQETYDLVAEIAAKTGLSMTQSVKLAASNHLQQMEQTRVAEIEAWIARVKANPLPDDFVLERDTTPYEPRVIFP